MEETVNQVQTKRCGVCGRVLPITEFSKDSRSPDKHLYCCRKCASEKQKKLRIKKNQDIFSLLSDKFTLSEWLEASELRDLDETAAKKSLSHFCRNGVVSRIDDAHYRKIITTPILEIDPTKVSPVERPSVLTVDKPLSSYKPIELLAELYSRGYRWKEMTMTVVTEIPMSNVQDYINNSRSRKS